MKPVTELRLQLAMLTERSLAGVCNLSIHMQSIRHPPRPQTAIPNPSLTVTFGERVKGVYHELEDAIPHKTVVERGRTPTSLEARLSLSGETKDAVSSQQ